MPDTITITDDRTGKTVTVPIEGGVFSSSALRELDPTLYCYDPAYLSTASCKSAITYLDGDAGILRYRGYPIEQLAEKSTYLEVAYLLLNGELPTTEQLAQWTFDVTHHTFIHENMRKRFVDGFHYDAHPMGMFVVRDRGTRHVLRGRQGHRRPGRPRPSDPADDRQGTDDRVDVLPVLGRPAVQPAEQRAVVPGQLPQHDVADRRVRGRPDPRAGDGRAVHPPRRPRAELRHDGDARHRLQPGRSVLVSGRGRSALYGPLHGGANEQVVRMLAEIGSLENVPAFIESVKAGKGRADGLRAPRLQELRPAGDDHQADRIRRVRRDRQEPAARRRAGPRGDGARPTRTSSIASCTRTSTSTRG